MVIVSYKDWTFQVDKEATLATYSSVPTGSAEGCNCADCRNYSANKEGIFPIEIELLLNQLGINHKKESEVWRMSKVNDQYHRYCGFFHYKGGFEGKDCFITTDRNSGTFSMTDINESFSIGFRVANDLTYFEDIENLVQVEYEINVPWTIDKKLEPEW